MTNPEKQTRRVAWLLTGLMLFSFTFGIFMFLPAEHRAWKLQEMEYKYRQRGDQLTTRLGAKPAPSTAAVEPD
ncbi:MAG: hypothetical protein HOC23_11045 [Halieaceae bacterium]|nr:hypothetical protein [Halieaceae bacterium]